MAHQACLLVAVQMAAASKTKVDSMTNLATVAFKERNLPECFKWCDKALRCRHVPVSVCATITQNHSNHLELRGELRQP